jgi:hypothetical protein
MRFDRVDPQLRWLDAGECQDVFSDDDVRLTQDWIRKGHVDAEALAVDLAREPALSAVAEAVVPSAPGSPSRAVARLLEFRRS